MTAMTHDTTPVSGASRPEVGGLLLALVSATSFGMSGALVRGLLDAGWSTGAAVTARVGIAALVLTGPALLSLRGRWELVRRNAGLLLRYGIISVAGCQFAFFSAVAHLQVGIAILIEYTAPVAVVTWLWLRYGHRPGRLTVAGGAVSAVGLLLVLDLTGAAVSLVGIGWALLAMLGTATFFVLSAQQGNGLPPLVLAAGGLLVGAVALALAGLVGLVPLHAATARVAYTPAEVPWWGAVLILGTVTAALSYTTGIAAGRRLGSRLASFVALSEVVAALVWAWLLVGELPRATQIAGGALILAGVVVVKLGERPASRGASG